MAKKIHRVTGRGLYKPIMIVTAYKMARIGFSEEEIARELGVSRQSYQKWLSLYPELAQAVTMAKHENSEGEGMQTWIYKRLPEDLRVIWDEISHWFHVKGGVNKIELILQNHGLRVRQQLFLHALTVCRFSASNALRRVNTSKKELDRWISTDPDFAELVEEIEWHKGNLYEEELHRLIRTGNPQAILFANRTYNKDRGYAPSSSVDVNVHGSVAHNITDLEEIMSRASEPCRQEVFQILRAMEAEKNRPQLPEPNLKNVNVIDVVARQVQASLDVEEDE